jgi:hypothetical protein
MAETLVPDPLVVHVLLLTHVYIKLFASLIPGILSVTDVQQHEVHVPNQNIK